MEILTMHIEGMSCGHCLNAVNQALASLTGVQVESVKIGRAELRYDPAKIHPRRDHRGGVPRHASAQSRLMFEPS
jgi:copper chaperone CopZ